MMAFLGQRLEVNNEMAITAQSIAQQQSTQGSEPVTVEASNDLRDTTTTVTLQVKVVTASGNKTMSWKYADPTAGYDEELKPFFQSLVTNGEIFQYPPLAVQSAKFVTKTETDVVMD